LRDAGAIGRPCTQLAVGGYAYFGGPGEGGVGRVGKINVEAKKIQVRRVSEVEKEIRFAGRRRRRAIYVGRQQAAHTLVRLMEGQAHKPLLREFSGQNRYLRYYNGQMGAQIQD
jgi:hypothetical protein